MTHDTIYEYKMLIVKPVYKSTLPNPNLENPV